MEAFRLLKYTSSGGGSSGVSATTTSSICTAVCTADASAAAETTVAASTGSRYSSDGEDGPYFDLEFALPYQESDVDEEPPRKSPESDQNPHDTENEDEAENDSGETSVHENDDDEEEDEKRFAIMSNECTDRIAALSPSDEPFLKGNLVSVEPSSILFNGSAEENSKLPVFLVKSATKFRVLLLKLKKPKSSNGGDLEKLEKSEKDGPNGKKDENQGKVSGKVMAVKFKVEQGPLLSLFTRDNGSKENGHVRVLELNVEDKILDSTDERKLTKGVVLQKYLKMLKPFNISVSKHYVEKLRSPGHLGGGSKGSPAGAAARGNVKHQLKQGNINNLQAGLKVVRKHLGKSRSASAVAAEAPAGKTASNRRDDSLIQLQDGIQGAILHCKSSFNAFRDVDSSSILCRSVSDPSYEKSAI